MLLEESVSSLNYFAIVICFIFVLASTLSFCSFCTTKPDVKVSDPQTGESATENKNISPPETVRESPPLYEAATSSKSYIDYQPSAPPWTPDSRHFEPKDVLPVKPTCINESQVLPMEDHQPAQQKPSQYQLSVKDLNVDQRRTNLFERPSSQLKPSHQPRTSSVNQPVREEQPSIHYNNQKNFNVNETSNQSINSRISVKVNSTLMSDQASEHQVVRFPSGSRQTNVNHHGNQVVQGRQRTNISSSENQVFMGNKVTSINSRGNQAVMGSGGMFVNSTGSQVAMRNGEMCINNSGNQVVMGNGGMCINNSGKQIVMGNSGMYINNPGNQVVMGSGGMYINNPGNQVVMGNGGMYINKPGKQIVMGNGGMCINTGGNQLVMGNGGMYFNNPGNNIVNQSGRTYINDYRYNSDEDGCSSISIISSTSS